MSLTALFEDKLAKLACHPTGFHNRDFLLTWEHTDTEISALLQVVDLLETMYAQGISTKLFDTGLAVSLFRDQSTRTRFSFASATNSCPERPRSIAATSPTKRRTRARSASASVSRRLCASPTNFS